jgi:hypothetical protein
MVLKRKQGRTMPNRERVNSFSSTTEGHPSVSGLRERSNTAEIHTPPRGRANATSGPLRERAGTADSVRSSDSHDDIAEFNQFKDHSASTAGSTRRRKLVDWIQKRPVPKVLVLKKERSLLPTDTPPKGENNNDTLYFVTGLDLVVFGTVAAADAVLIAGIKPPRYLWYMLSGACCDVIQFFIDVLLHIFFDIQDASVCWALGFTLSIFFRHTTHRYFVFGDYVGGYWNSLARIYAGYSVIIVLSTLFNFVMTKVGTLSHYGTWLLTLMWTGIANYFILKRIWSFGGPSSTSKIIPSALPATIPSFPIVATNI